MSATQSDGPSLLAMEALRMAPAYQAAEMNRRKKDAQSMAQEAPSSPEYANVRLLISTWDGIGATVRMGLVSEDAVFLTQPVCHMWTELKDAVMALRQSLNAQDYAANFEWLYNAFEDWVKSRPPTYRTQSCSGIHAKFG